MKRILDKINKTDTCWLWTGSIRSEKTGYGCVKFGGKVVNVHRLMYEFVYGKIPDGKLVCHSCDVRLCVNPDHLWLGTCKENMQDASRKGRIVVRKIYANAKERRAANWARYYKKHGRRLLDRRLAKRKLRSVG